MLLAGDGSPVTTYGRRHLVKKKTTKKLVLAKETVRQLEEGTLVRGAGASGSDCLHSECLQCANTNICNTYTTCGSRAC
jgi:hypothetical protein